MNCLVIDISGKVLKYDVALCEAIFKQLNKDDHLSLFAANINPREIKCPSKKLLSIVPRFLQNSENKAKRVAKAIEGVVNFFYLTS